MDSAYVCSSLVLICSRDQLLCLIKKIHKTDRDNQSKDMQLSLIDPKLPIGVNMIVNGCLFLSLICVII